MAICWISLSFTVVVAVAELFEWRFELWTPKGRRIMMYKKPMDETWFNWNKRVEPLPTEEIDRLLEDSDRDERRRFMFGSLFELCLVCICS